MSEALNDARLIARYAGAHGLLPDDSPLPDVIARATAQLAVGRLTAAQQQELNRAISVEARRIFPVTIEQLRADATAASRPVRTILITTIVSVICAMLMFVIVPLTTNFNRLNVFVNELKPADVYEFFATMTDARVLQGRLIDARGLANQAPIRAAPPKGKPPAPAPPPKVDQATIDKLDADLKAKVKYLQEADSRISVNLESINRVMDDTGAPRWYALIIESYGLDDAAQFLLYRVLRMNEPQRVVTGLPVIDTENNRAKVNCASWDREERDEQAKPGSVVNPKRPGIYWKALCENRLYAEGVGLRVTTPGVVLAASQARQHAESFNILLGSAILPLLYGLLGASVFLLRQAWGEDTNVARARPLTIAAFLRLALGGFAGLAIGWFWVPTSKAAGDLTTLTTTPFALAFLAGFSIELLFAILDRVLNAINPPQHQAVAPAPPDPAGPRRRRDDDGGEPAEDQDRRPDGTHAPDGRRTTDAAEEGTEAQRRPRAERPVGAADTRNQQQREETTPAARLAAERAEREARDATQPQPDQPAADGQAPQETPARQTDDPPVEPAEGNADPHEQARPDQRRDNDR